MGGIGEGDKKCKYSYYACWLLSQMGDCWMGEKAHDDDSNPQRLSYHIRARPVCGLCGWVAQTLNLPDVYGILDYFFTY